LQLDKSDHLRELFIFCFIYVIHSSSKCMTSCYNSYSGDDIQCSLCRKFIVYLFLLFYNFYILNVWTVAAWRQMLVLHNLGVQMVLRDELNCFLILILGKPLLKQTL
jgi:hypothetical protein